MAKTKSVVVITPSQRGFSCQVEPEQNPPVVENDIVKFRVKVRGGHGPFHWKLPLYQVKNGSNDVSMARIGDASLDENRSFLIEMNVVDLQKVMKEELAVLLESKERYQARCTTPAAPIRVLASSQKPKEFEIIEGSLVPR